MSTYHNLVKTHSKKNIEGLFKDIISTLEKNPKSLKKKELNSFIHLLFVSKKLNFLTQLFIFLEEKKIAFNKGHIINLLLENKIEKPEVFNSLIKPMKDSEILIMVNNGIVSNLLLQKSLEKVRFKLYEKQKQLKQDLIEKFDFFRTQHLEEKAKETLEELLQSFPNEPSLEKYISKEREKKYEKVLSLTAKKSLRTYDFDDDEIISEEDLKIRREWFKLWKESFGEKNSLLLQIQMKFLEFDEDQLLSQSFLELPELDIWDRIELMHKTQRHYEGLVLLDQIEAEILAKQPEMVYNFYYYKALLLKGAGLDKEAFSILEAIIEQNASFRDVKYLFKKWQ